MGILNDILDVPRGLLGRSSDWMAKLSQSDETTDAAKARRYNTTLYPWERAGFENWMQQQNQIRAAKTPSQGSIVLDLPEYDIQGAYLAGVGGSGHGPDMFKKPYHMTFSNESQYNNRDGYQGGYWIPGSQEYFVPGSANINMHGWDELRNYFANREPQVKLVEQMEY